MILGFTGTRAGMTQAQATEVRRLLEELGRDLTHVAHGDCIGADADFDGLVCQLAHQPWRLIHPSDQDHARAHCATARPRHSLVYPSHPPLRRNQHIVAQASWLLACPRGEHIRRSGTWATVRAAVQAGREVLIVMPSGERVRRGRAAP